SAITGIAVDQSIAITGSINQYGEVQSVGGVNEKIEGFHRLCKERGLNGNQGVILPATNTVNLMLNDAVISDVENGNFHIYRVANINEALALLMNKEPGTSSASGHYPKNSIHGIATERLKRLSSLSNNN
ncbi:MAG: S16 family serine protease, partial [Pseudomonadota bacterium]|nr:S16 family serine protease [Pseudomonadota bacterium]